MAVKKCCIENCKSCSTRKEDIGVTYHKFPKDVNFRDIWIKVTHNKNTNLPTYVCSRHFRKSDFQTYKDSKYVLKSDAVPSIFPWVMADKTETVTMDPESTTKHETNEDIKDTSGSSNEGENLDAIRKFIEAQERDIQEQKLDKNIAENEFVESANMVKEEFANVVDEESAIKVNEESVNKVNEGSVNKVNEGSVNKMNEESVNKVHEVSAVKVNKGSANKVNEENVIFKTEQPEESSVASNVMQMILSESEAKIAEKKDLNVSKSHINAGNLDKGNGSVALSVGSKVEAKDFGEFWHSAQIVEVDYDEMEVLVRYEYDMKKHDEWISVSSPRLRPFGSPATKTSTPTEETLNAEASQSVTVNQEVTVTDEDTVKSEHLEDKLKSEEKPKLQFAVGERCLARWRDNRRFIATVHVDLGNGHYEVIFDDGFHWKCTTTRMYKLKQSTNSGDGNEMTSTSPSISPILYGAGPSTSMSVQSPTATTNLPYHTHLFDPTRDYLGSKSERREMKRKLNIKEIFNIGQKRRKKQKSPKERAPKKQTIERESRAIKKVPEPKASVSSCVDFKKDIPDAIASIIGTKDVPDELKMKSENEIKTNAKVLETMESTDGDKTKQNICVKSEMETGANLDILNLQDNKSDDDPVIKEEKLEKFEKQDDGKHEEVIDKIKEVINKLEDGINKVENMDSPKPAIKEAVVLKQEEPIDGMKVVLNKLDDKLLNKLDDKLLKSENIIIPKVATEKVTVKQEENKTNQSELDISDKDKSKRLSKIKKGKKLRLLQEKKVKKQVEKVKNELEEMKKQVEEMRKQMLMKTEEISKPKKMEMPESFLLPGEWCCRWVNGQPVGEVSEMECDAKVDANNKPGLPRRSVQVEDKRLPPGWTKHMVRRSLGHSAGKWDVVLVSPENRRFHTKTDMRNYLENSSSETIMNYEHALMDFGVHLKLSRRMGWVNDTPDQDKVTAVVPTPPELLSNNSPLVKRRKLDVKKKRHRVKGAKQRLSLPIQMPQAPFDASASVAPPAPTDTSTLDSSWSSVDMSHNTPLEDGYVYVGSLKVQIIDNLLRCPAKGCYKNFRNNTLLQMHIKHYHRELRKMMGATPKVLDLAYARTMPTETEVTKPKDDRTIKIKIIRPSKRVDEPKHEIKHEVKTETQLDFSPTTPIKSEERAPKPQDSPKLRNALINKPVKRPKVLLPVRRVEPERVVKESNEEIPEDNETMDSQFEEVFEPLDFETAISTHTVTKPTLEKRKKEKKKCFATISKKPTSEDDEWFGVNSDMDTRLSFPRSGTPDSRVTDSRMENLAQPMSSESNGEQKDVNVYMYTENGERIKIVHMKREEIINCHCGFREEDGLMVQCELCLCWQHALCHNIQKESEVPEKYTCSICLNPRRGRRSQRFLHDQDRLYEGLLPGAKPDESLRRSHELSGNLLRIQDALHALRVKYYVATKKDHPKLYLWAKDWENAELNLTQEKLNSDYSDLNIMINNIGKENLPMKPDEIKDMQLDIKTSSSEEQETERFGERDNHLGSQSLLSGLLSSPCGASLELPISTCELEKLASVQEVGSGVVVPQPEAAIENDACRERLLRHLTRCHALIDARLDSIEAQVAELESQDPSFEDDETAEYFPRTKQTIQMLLRDLDTMEELGVLT